MIDPSLAHSINRRRFLQGTGLGFGGMASNSMLGSPRPAPKAKAKSVIWLFMRGGVSHMESFDPKPALNDHAGKSIPDSPYASVLDPEKFANQRVVVVGDANGKQRNKLYPLQVGYKQYGESGTAVSDWFPNIGKQVDDLAIIRSMWTTDNNHGAQVQFHSGRHMLDPHEPTIGAWINYGLGSLNDDLPQFINIGPRFFDKRDGHYLGPAYDAVNLKIDPKNPLNFAKPDGKISPEEQKATFDLTGRLNRLSAKMYPSDPALEARIKSYELAYRMQSAVPETINFDGESEATKKLYGIDQKETRPFGEQLLAARRFVERGVRFIQIMHGDGAAGAWDQHSQLKKNHAKLAGQVDLPTAGLLQDLKQRGLLEDTIVVFATEFGRTPGSQGADGRDHHPYGFSVWMAGGGIKGGVVHGSTDEIGFHAVEHPHYVTDIHATLLHQLGLDGRSLEVSGHKRIERDYGKVISEILT
jgi:hypothetical protein